MVAAAIPLLALAPGLFWLWIFTRQGSYRPEPRSLLIQTFMLGMAATVPAAILEGVLISSDIENETDFGSVAVVMLLIVGPVEEVTKFLAVRLFAYRTRYFEEPMDALVYGAAASLGFASLENLFYMIAYGPEVIVLRGPLSTLGHVTFGSFWALALGWSHGRRRGGWVVLAGLLAAAAVHGAFNIAAVAELIAVAAAMVALGGVWTWWWLSWAQRTSRFRDQWSVPMLECPQCRVRLPLSSRFCAACGARLFTGRVRLACGRCKASNRPDARFCTSCGDRFVLGGWRG